MYSYQRGIYDGDVTQEHRNVGHVINGESLQGERAEGRGQCTLRPGDQGWCCVGTILLIHGPSLGTPPDNRPCSKASTAERFNRAGQRGGG